MDAPTSPLSPDRWIETIFASKAARDGKVVRRSLHDIQRYATLDRFTREVQRRGYAAVRNGDQIVIFCNQDGIRRFA
ncbi:MAG: N-(5'-phosphoribosyl)anthranilate isomerase [Pseudomonadota bacterium]